MANTTTGAGPSLSQPTTPDQPPGFFQGSNTKLLNVGVNPFNQYVWPLPPQPPHQDFSFYARRFLGLATTNTQPFQQQQWEFPTLPQQAYPTGVGRSNFTSNIIGFPLVELVEGGRMTKAQVVAGTYGAAGGAMSNAKLIVQGLMP